MTKIRELNVYLLTFFSSLECERKSENYLKSRGRKTNALLFASEKNVFLIQNTSFCYKSSNDFASTILRAVNFLGSLTHSRKKLPVCVYELYNMPLLLIFLFVDCYYNNNSILWSKYPKNLWRWPPSSSLPPHLQSQLPLPLCLFTTAEPWQQRHRGYYGCYNVKVDRKVASPVLFFFFVYALCVIYVQGFFSAVSSRSSSRSKQAAVTSQTGLAFHSTTPYYGDDDGLLRFVFFALYQPS